MRTTIEFVFLYSDLGMDEEADRWIRRIRLESPEHPVAMMLPAYGAIYEKDFARGDELTGQLMQTDLSNFPNLRAARVFTLTMADRADEALALVEGWYPELLAAEPVVDASNHDLSTETMFALNRAGMHEQLRRLQAVEEAHQRRDHLNRPPAQNARVLAGNAAAAGDTEKAVRLLREAVDQGWLGTAEWGWKLTESEYLGAAASSPEVIELQKRLDTALAAQREAVRQQLVDLGPGVRF